MNEIKKAWEENNDTSRKERLKEKGRGKWNKKCMELSKSKNKRKKEEEKQIKEDSFNE